MQGTRLMIDSQNTTAEYPIAGEISMSVILVSDQAIVIEGVLSILNRSEHRLGNIHTFSRCSDLLGTITDTSHTVIFLDWSADWDLKIISDIAPGTTRPRTILMARSPTPELIYLAQEAGASGVLDTTSSRDEITAFIDDVLKGELSSFRCSMVSAVPKARAIRLTPRQGELVSLLSQGLKNKEIAAYLGLSEGTVKVYLSKLFQKVGAKDRFEIALFGLKNMVHTSASSRERRPSTTVAEHTPIPRLSSLVVAHSNGLERLAV